jgi:hypothetical protein
MQGRNAQWSSTIALAIEPSRLRAFFIIWRTILGHMAITAYCFIAYCFLSALRERGGCCDERERTGEPKCKKAFSCRCFHFRSSTSYAVMPAPDILRTLKTLIVPAAPCRELR